MAREARVAETGHQRAAHLARSEFRQAIQHVGARRGVEALAPVVVGADLRVEALRDRARSRVVGRLDLVDVHAVEDRTRDRALVVGGGDPDHLAGVDRHLGEFVGEGLGGVVFHQGVQGPERVVGVLAARLVDLVDHHHRVGIFAVDQGLENLSGARALPLTGRTAEHPAGGQGAHRDEAHAGAQQLGDLARECVLPTPGGPSSRMGMISRASRLSWHSAIWRFTSSRASWKLGSSS